MNFTTTTDRDLDDMRETRECSVLRDLEEEHARQEAELWIEYVEDTCTSTK